MNQHVSRVLTAGEKALISAYEADFGSLPGNAEVMATRDNAVSALRKDGLPTRRVEAWHYTDLRTLFRGLPEAGDATEATPLIDGAAVFAIGAERSWPMPDGVTARSVEDDLRSGAATSLIGARNGHDAVGLISTAFADRGIALDIAAGASPEQPLQIDLASADTLHAVNRVTIGASARASLLVRAHGAGLASEVTQLALGDGAEATVAIVQDMADDATRLARMAVTLGRDAKLMLIVVNTGGGLVRQEVEVRVEGEGADFRMRAVNLLSGKRHVDLTMEVVHSVESTTSTEFVRNVATGSSRGVFQGQIRVAAEAQKTDARMACNTLLLSDDADVSAKPELEIFADDVACGHGATVAEIDSDHLFYLMARGIPAPTARGLLVKAFVQELMDEIEDEALHDALAARLDAWLAREAGNIEADHG